jgi:WD40 repeat protein/tRNA A-37 threonylcarbamoyl transferase component Bud32
MALTCPHCQSPVEQADRSAEEILCPACGSSFRVQQDTTIAWSSDRGPRAIGKYELIEAVGTGGFGTVYKARDPQLDRTVALKVPRSGRLADQTDVDRFLREARSVARLTHPAIVPVHDVGEHEGVPYLVSDFVQGMTLTDVLSARRLPAREAAELVAAIADALQYAHEQGIIHRDVKPSNILLDGAGRPHLMDFGLARRDAGDVTMTTDGQVLGTPAYMSPEQARGEGHRVDGRSDVYSLGVVLYQMLTGELPFRGTPRMLLHQVLNEEPRSARSLNDRIPRDLETICLKAMAKEPARRYARAGEMAADVRRFLAGEPIRARRTGPAERTWSWAKRNPAIAGLLTSLFLVLSAGLVVSTAFWRISDANAKTLAWRLYVNRVNRAYLEAMDNNVRSAEGLLAACPADLRGWEWRFVNRLCHLQLGTLAQPSQIHALAFSADGRTIASCGGYWPDRAHAGTGELIVRDLETGRECFAHHGLANVVQGVAFHPGGRTLATAGGRGKPSAEGELALWDATTGQLVERRVVEGHQATCVAIRTDGKQLAVGFNSASTDPGHIQLCDAETGEERSRIPGPTRGLWALSYSPDGRRLAVSGDTSVDVWNLKGEEPRRHTSLGGFTSYVYAVAFSRDGKQIAAGGWDKTVKIWDVATGDEVRTLTGHTGFVRSLDFSPDGRTLVSASEDRAVKLWELATGRELGTFRGHAHFAMAVAFHPDGDRLASGGTEGAVKLWSASTSLPVVMDTGGYVWSLAFRRDGSRLATSPGMIGNDFSVKLWNPLTGEQISSFRAQPFPPGLLSYGPGERTINAIGQDRVAKVLDANDGRVLASFSSPGNGTIFCTAYHPDGRQAATRNPDGTVTLWDTGTGQETRTLRGHSTAVTGVAYSADGRLLASASARPDGAGYFKPGGEVKVWDVETGREIRTLRRETGVFQVLAFSPDASRLALAEGGSFATSGEAHVWDVATGGDVFILRGHTSNVTGVVFSPDGKRLASSSIDRTIKLWDMATGEEVLTLRGHTSGVASLDFSADGHRLASGGIDWTARIWDARP